MVTQAAPTRAPQTTDRFDLEQLAYEAETTIERARRLVEIGAITRGEDGLFGRGDVIRSRAVQAFEDEGFSLEQMELAIRERGIDLQSVPLFYPDPSARTGRTFRELMDDLGPRGELAAQALAAMGLTAPSPDAPVREMEEELLRELVQGWSSVDEEYTLRAARIFGDAARRAAEGWVALFAEAIAGPVESRSTELDEVLPKLLTPAMTLSPLMPRLIAWLLDRHLERSMNDLNIARIERRLQSRGLMPAVTEHPPAVAFVDMSGFTRLTIESGDEHGARASIRLGELAEAVVRRYGGRVVKLLGDGVLLLFPAACEAVDAVAMLAREMVKAGLPAAHAGIHVGPVVERDGDVYGSTVNIASRIAGHAPGGSILVSDPVAQACPDHLERFEHLGAVAIRGLPDPIALCRWRPLA